MSIATLATLWEQLRSEYIDLARARDASGSPNALNAWARAQHADYFVKLLRHSDSLTFDPLITEKYWPPLDFDKMSANATH